MHPLPVVLCRILAVAVLAAPVPLAAQGRPGGVELGFDGGFEFSNVEDLVLDDATRIESGDQFRIGIPIQRFRVGYHASDLISIEPSIGLDYLKIEDPQDDSDAADLSRTDLQLGLGILIHFRRDPDNPVAYGIARGSYNLVDENRGAVPDEQEESASQFGAGAGVGVKLPAADRLDVRLEGMYERRFEKEDDRLPASNNYILNVGFSWYTGER